MKKHLLKILIMAFFSIFSKGSAQEKTSVHDLNYTSIEGETVSLKDFEGKYILFVNVASECGFTPQYEGLETLSEQYRDQLVVLGLPCDQFGGQEPGGSEEIQSFCKVRYGVSFPLSEKITVKGKDQHGIYKWLTTKAENGKSNSTVKWNFQKYLVGPNGEFVDYFYSITKPLSEKITKNFN
ncbi:MAG: glutathione peroxidase [Flavobacteriales bacterium]|jgi:glutathione peroxidase|tara:strand:+ start:895 stop:1440 length:546 start_codon:yes stop_codon:yes gene_type:complete